MDRRPSDDGPTVHQRLSNEGPMMDRQWTDDCITMDQRWTNEHTRVPTIDHIRSTTRHTIRSTRTSIVQLISPPSQIHRTFIIPACNRRHVHEIRVVSSVLIDRELNIRFSRVSWPSHSPIYPSAEWLERGPRCLNNATGVTHEFFAILKSTACRLRRRSRMKNFAPAFDGRIFG